MPNLSTLAATAHHCLQQLCVAIPDRRVGSPGNRAAAQFCADHLRSTGLAVTTPEFACLDWRQSGATLTGAGQTFAAHVSPYSPEVQATAPLAVVDTVAALEAVDAAGQILLVAGELTREPLMPKSFTFYNPPEHQHLIRLLETQQPLAIVTATGRHPEMAGAAYPFPLLEDGDFDIPSVYLTDVEGERLRTLAGRTVTLAIRAERRPATGCNVLARRGDGEHRIVFCAHLDAKDGTPGALDNAAGVTGLLLLAELLADYAGRRAVEVVLFNGEDYYANSGEMLYLEQNAGRFAAIDCAVNLDGLGYRHGDTAFSLYECPPSLAAAARAALTTHPGLCEGDPWLQGDHALFLMHQRPALALTSERVTELMAQIVHTERDRPDMVDPAKLAAAAVALRDLAGRLDQVDW